MFKKSFVCSLLFLVIVPLVPAQERVLAEWTFDKPGDLQGWIANGHIAEAKVADGALAARTTGSDPILEYRPRLEIAASPWQIIEIRLKSDRDGFAQIFWSNTTEGRYGGFDGEKTTDFNVIGDGQWHRYRLMPFWQKEGKIVRLRFDLAGGMTFALDSFRILEMATPAPVSTPVFDFAAGAPAWRPLHAARTWTTNNGMAMLTQTSDDFALAPPVRVDAQERSFVALRMTATQGRQGRIYFATDRQPGLNSLAFPIIADGRAHFYNVDLLAAPAWQGRVVALGLQPTDATNSVARIHSLAVTEEPQGPPQLTAASFALEEAAPRIGIAGSVAALIANTGGGVATNLRAELNLPTGMKLIASPSEATLHTPLGYGDEVRLVWQVMANQPITNEISLRVTADQTEPLLCRAPVQFSRGIPPGTIRIHSATAPVVPQPQPVRGKYDVGVYYFPGWKFASQWQPLERFPERKPVLGWYREGEPEVADWHIKWAVEHGITFFAYDWYWVKGARQLEHALHDGYFKSRYQSLLKFCLLWANHNPPNTHSVEDSIAVTRYWITNFFHRPEHYRIDDKPVVIIFSPHNYRADLGVEGVNRAFAAMREECRHAGLPGLYLIACVADPREVDGESYDAVTCYNWAGLGLSGSEKRGPYATLIEGYRRHWDAFLTRGSLPLMIPISGGWDSRPWHGDTAMVRHDRTPAQFKQHLHAARAVLEGRPTHTNLLKAVLIEAWNEWGEGSYIEPHKEYGFAYLDAIREAFTDAPANHTDLAPVDVGLGPYDVPPLSPGRTAWTFDQSAEGWDNPMHCDAIKASPGILTTTTTGNDPALFGPPMQARAAGFGCVKLRLRLTPANGQPLRDMGQLFWRTKRWAESEASSVRFPMVVDGQWHDYDLKVGENARWRGVITRLRLDVGTRAGIKVELDTVGLQP